MRLIPSNPQWEPRNAESDSALAILKALTPRADAWEAEQHEGIVFVDQGSNFEEVRCPHCGDALDMDWFGEQMRRPSLDDLSIVTPCCGAHSTLNELDFRWPA